MLFHSHIFLMAFLPLTLAAFYASARHVDARCWLLISASLIFYGYWDPRLLPLLLASVGANWLTAWLFQRSAVRVILTVGITFNLGLLGVFKYADFFGETLAAITGSSHQAWGIVLPLGISFFTFQQISYLADLGRGNAPLYRFRDFALFVTFFPQLIAGPIVRHDEVISQYALNPFRDGFHERLGRGSTLLLIGVFKKVVIADPLARFVDPLFAAAAAGNHLGAADAWLATLGFTFQIYFDFSGYSDMAVGLAAMFGLTLPFNFDSPYRALSVREFWQRWHMTLSRFLRDYLYIPLGGSRHGLSRGLAALLCTMLLGGLWHGAAWTFVAWGCLHGIALGIGRLWQLVAYRFPRPVNWLFCLLFVMLSWVPFRAPDFSTAFAILKALFGANGWDLPLAGISYRKVWWLLPAFGLATLGPTSQRLALEILQARRAVAFAVGIVWFVMLLLVGDWKSEDFIYFQF